MKKLTFEANEVMKLRRQLGRVIGKPQLSRARFATLVRSSPGSVFNWERGACVPSRHLREQLAKIERALKSGELTADMVKGTAKSRGKTKRPARGVEKKTRFAGDAPVLYANEVEVIATSEEARVRFALVAPGSSSGYVVCDLILPRRLLKKIAS